MACNNLPANKMSNFLEIFISVWCPGLWNDQNTLMSRTSQSSYVSIGHIWDSKLYARFTGPKSDFPHFNYLKMEVVMMTSSNENVTEWKRYWPYVRGIHRSPVNSPHKGQWRGASMFSLICVWINGWVNNREAGDLRHHCGRYDVIVILSTYLFPVGWGLPSRVGSRRLPETDCASTVAERASESWRGARFTNGPLLAIQIGWKISFSVIQSSELSCHVQKFCNDHVVGTQARANRNWSSNLNSDGKISTR